MEKYFQYGEKELSYLKSKDKRLAEVIDKVGMVKRRVIPDLFAALVHSIVGQQISTRAHETIWQKLLTHFGTITPAAIACNASGLRSGKQITSKVRHVKSSVESLTSRSCTAWLMRKSVIGCRLWTASEYGLRK